MDNTSQEQPSGSDLRSPAEPSPRTAAVAIGRNEGERLKRCLRSVVGRASPVVYVDSGSTDGSVEFARSLGVEVVALDMSTPFTAARARNEGIARALQLAPELTQVQVLDGDCELVEGFMEAASSLLRSDPSLGVVCGRRREIFPEASVYNLLCDMEWNTPVGEATACGGDALIRLAAFGAAGGYDDSLIAGEEPDLCARMRQKGYRILRIDREMTRHDAAMSRIDQWWKRNLRAGHACAEGLARHPEVAWNHKEVRSNLLWGLAVPAAALGLAGATGGQSLSLFTLHGVLWYRIRRYRMRTHGDSERSAGLYATYVVLGKLPQAAGVLQYRLNRLRGKRAGLIEYK